MPGKGWCQVSEGVVLLPHLGPEGDAVLGGINRVTLAVPLLHLDLSSPRIGRVIDTKRISPRIENLAPWVDSWFSSSRRRYSLPSCRLLVGGRSRGENTTR